MWLGEGNELEVIAVFLEVRHRIPVKICLRAHGLKCFNLNYVHVLWCELGDSRGLYIGRRSMRLKKKKPEKQGRE